MYVYRAVDQFGQVIDVYAYTRRDQFEPSAGSGTHDRSVNATDPGRFLADP
jgi:hypothetical protein